MRRNPPPPLIPGVDENHAGAVPVNGTVNVVDPSNCVPEPAVKTKVTLVRSRVVEKPCTSTLKALEVTFKILTLPDVVTGAALSMTTLADGLGLGSTDAPREFDSDVMVTVTVPATVPCENRKELGIATVVEPGSTVNGSVVLELLNMTSLLTKTEGSPATPEAGVNVRSSAPVSFEVAAAPKVRFRVGWVPVVAVNVEKFTGVGDTTVKVAMFDGVPVGLLMTVTCAGPAIANKAAVMVALN